MLVISIKNIKASDSEIIGALVNQVEHQGWQELGDSFDVYFMEEEWNKVETQEVIQNIISQFHLSCNTKMVENINWNEQWEKDYEPVYIDKSVYIKSLFHPALDFEYTITIQPKMSFGTGHHATTRLMCKLLLELNCSGKNVIDIGTGTGILAILARLRGAQYVLATDYDIWCFENTKENIALNNLEGIEVELSETITHIDKTFDIIIANIHKNYQLENMHAMNQLLNQNGKLLISGFYETDANNLLNLADSLGLTAQSIKTENNWCAICLSKRVETK